MKGRMNLIRGWFIVASLAIASSASAAAITFETRSNGLTPFLEGDSVGSEFFASAGITLTNATIVTPSLNTVVFGAESPAHSGLNVVIDDGGPLSILFANPVSAFSGYFTYFAPLTLQAFDTSNSPLAPVLSAFAGNYGSSGNPVNELLAVTFAPGISRVLLTGDPAGSSFTFDDLTFTVANTGSQVPEPATLSMLCLGGLYLGWRHVRDRALPASDR
jgi:hypothetical protein